jgi:hypothetical protein
VDDHLVAAPDQTTHDVGAHAAKADHTDLHDWKSFKLLRASDETPG